MTPAQMQELEVLLRARIAVESRVLESCTGKDKFETPTLAMKAARNFKGTAEHYRCRVCGKFHVGSKLRPRLVLAGGKS